MTLTISQPRRDGKYPVTIVYPGAPNMFGGFYPAKVYRKLYPLEKVRELVTQHGTPEQRSRFK